MKWNIKILFLLTLFIFSLVPAFSTGKDSIFDFAQKLEENKADKQAALEYKRFIFFEEESNSKTLHALQFLRDYYHNNKDHLHAKKYSRLASQTAQLINSPDKDAAFITEIQILAENTSAINKEPLLLAYTFDTYSKKVNRRAWSELIKTNLKLQNFDQARNYFNTAAQNNVFSKEETAVINSSFEELFNCSPKNPKIALGLSFIPGLGQCYAHNFKDGLNAFVLNGSLMALSAYSVYTGNYADLFYFELSPLLRFYRGNLYNAQKEVFDYNDRLFEEKTKNILKICNSIY